MNSYIKTAKVLIAFTIIIAVTFWLVNTVRPRSYEGSELAFLIGDGTVSLTNNSDEAASIQLIGSGSRTFRVSSTIENVSGASTRQGSGSSSTQLFEFDLPSGSSEFTVSSGTEVNFVANTSNLLQARVNPMNDDTFNLMLIVTTFIVAASLFYASNTFEHSWINWLRSQFTSVENFSADEASPVPVVADSAQGQNMRSFGDNRKK